MKSFYLITTALFLAVLAAGCSSGESSGMSAEKTRSDTTVGGLYPAQIGRDDLKEDSTESERFYRDYARTDTDSTSGPLQMRAYTGVLPLTAGEPKHCRLVIISREFSGDGVFMLTTTDSGGRNSEVPPSEYEGKRYTLRGMAGNDDATVWQLKSGNGRIFNFLYCSGDSSLILLNDRFEKYGPRYGYVLHPDNSRYLTE